MSEDSKDDPKFRNYYQCPSCDEVFRLNMAVTPSIWKVKTTEQKSDWIEYRDSNAAEFPKKLKKVKELTTAITTMASPEAVFDQFSEEYLYFHAQKTKVFACPGCSSTLQLSFLFIPIVVRKVSDMEIVAKARLARPVGPMPLFSSQEIEILEQAEKSGVLKMFEEALREAMSRPPTKVNKAFLQALRTLKKTSIPGPMLRRLGEELKTSYDSLTAWESHLVIFVSVDNQLRYFIPKYLWEDPVPKNDQIVINGLSALKEKTSMKNWLRSGKGYVPAGACLFINELREQSKFRVVSQ